MGKCVSNKIGHLFSFCFDVITELWQGFYCHFLVNLEYLVDLAQIEGVGRCYCQHYG